MPTVRSGVGVLVEVVIVWSLTSDALYLPVVLADIYVSIVSSAHMVAPEGKFVAIVSTTVSRLRKRDCQWLLRTRVSSQLGTLPMRGCCGAWAGRDG